MSDDTLARIYMNSSYRILVLPNICATATSIHNIERRLLGWPFFSPNKQHKQHIVYYGTWAYSHALHATANNDTNTIKIKRITARLYWTYFIANFIYNLNTCNQHHVGHF